MVLNLYDYLRENWESGYNPNLEKIEYDIQINDNISNNRAKKAILHLLCLDFIRIEPDFNGIKRVLKGKRLLSKNFGYSKFKKNIKDICSDLGLVHIKKSEYKEAIKVYKILLSYYSMNIDAWIELGILYRCNRKYKKSVQAFNQALKIDMNNTYALIQLGSTFKSMGNYKLAIKNFKRACKIDPHNILALVRLAIILKEINKYKKALKIIKKAHEIDSEHIEILDILGGIYYDLKKYRKSIDVYKKALSLNTENYWLWFMLGSNYRKLNLLDNAIEAYMEAYRIVPGKMLTLQYLIKTFYKQGNLLWTKISCQLMLSLYPFSNIAKETFKKISRNKLLTQ